LGWGEGGKGIVNGEAVEPSTKVTAQVLRGTSRYSQSLDSCSTLDNKVVRNDARSSVVSISTPFLCFHCYRLAFSFLSSTFFLNFRYVSVGTESSQNVPSKVRSTIVSAHEMEGGMHLLYPIN
jgi:hypothetical protein